MGSWNGAAVGVFGAALLVWWAKARTQTLDGAPWLTAKVLGLDVLVTCAVGLLVGLVLLGAAKLINRSVPWLFWASLVAAVILLIGVGPGLSLLGSAVIGLVALLTGGLLGAAARRGRQRRGIVAAAAATVVAMVIGAFLIWPGPGRSTSVPTPTVADGQPVASAAYGPGTSLSTGSYDATRDITGWPKESDRSTYWGFDASRLPVRGTLWYSTRPGKHPLVLITHGNGTGQNHSERGFDYLAQTLAGQGYVVGLVDQNFLNTGLLDRGSPVAGLDETRARLLLVHAARLTQGVGTTPAGGQIDGTRIALVGHSRGGEAVSYAAALNDRSGEQRQAVRSVVAIALSDNLYSAQDKTLSTVSYLTIGGALDADIGTFAGLRQYARVSPPASGLKAAVAVPSANHNQFNTRWGRTDANTVGLTARLLDLNRLMEPQQQRDLTTSVVTGFLRSTLSATQSMPQPLPQWLTLRGTHSQYLPGTAVTAKPTTAKDKLPGKNSSTMIPTVHLTSGGTQSVSVSLPRGSGRTLLIDLADGAPAGSAQRASVRVSARDSAGATSSVALPDLPGQLPGDPHKLAWLRQGAASEPAFSTYRIAAEQFSGLTGEPVTVSVSIVGSSEHGVFVGPISRVP